MDIHPLEPAVLWRLKRRWMRAAGAVALAATLAGCATVPGIVTFESADSASSGAGGGKTFDAKSYVDKIWTSKVPATVSSDATPVDQLLTAIKANKDAAAKQYGHQSGTGSLPAFLTTATGTVTDVDDSVPQRPMTLQVPGVPADMKVQVVTGQVIAGTALRDGLGFINFSDFTNQLDYADAATELNNRVKSDVLAKVDPASLKGKKVNVEGAFSLVTPSQILIVPTKLEPAS
jgi:predicted lipoprotein